MKIYRIASPLDVKDIGIFLSEQDEIDRSLYFGYNMQPEAIQTMYEKNSNNLNKQTFVVVRDSSSYALIGFIHLAHTLKTIELGIFIDPFYRKQGIGGNLFAMAMLYTFVLMNKNMEMQCINRNYDIMQLIKNYDKTLDSYSDERVAIILNTVENQRKAITRIGKAMWNY